MKNNIYIFIVGTLIMGLFIFNFDLNKSKVETKTPSRLWMEYAMDLVREKKPTPPESSRFYATVATVYFEALENSKDEKIANTATVEIINYVYPDKVSSTTNFVNTNNLKISDDTSKVLDILTKLKNRYESDNSKVYVKKVFATKNNPYWIGDKPFSPQAGQWQRWNTLGQNFSVPFPPEFMGTVYLEELEQVKNAALNRTTEQAALVNFWGGVPGTEAPAGIWQNRFYDTTKDLKLSNSEYAKKQMILAQAVADSFLECWQNKFAFNTKRPSMAAEISGQEINLAMPNPPFPGYVSGHSTISFTAATVLAQLIPSKKEIYIKDAETAKNSRLWAGIHFPVDNEEGMKLGEKIGQYYIDNIIK
jgi:tetrahydromethanopterin S-methyltransferase subunit B